MGREEYDFFREYDEHADVYEFKDEETALRGYIAVHRRRGRLSTGGTRFYAYRSDSDALRDALRLSAAMTAKCVVAGLPYGGSKCVIIGDPKTMKNEKLLVSYAEIVSMLQGEVFTGEDVGMTEADVQVLIEHSPFFNGKTGFAGDPSPFAAESVHVVMKSAIELFLPERSLMGETVAIKGLGKVGGALLARLVKDTAKVIGADIDERAVEKARTAIPELAVEPSDAVAFVECLVYAPCAFGREVRMDNFDRFRAKIICGGANNQLEQPSLANQLMMRGVLYVPDYLANAGGLINVSEELEGDGYHPERVAKRIAALTDILAYSMEESRKKGVSLADSVDAYVLAQLNN